jgi:DNA-binding NtrC family response regulator
LHRLAAMLRFDRYLVSRRRVLDLATGQHVQITRAPQRGDHALFVTCDGRTLIDTDASDGRAVHVFERWTIGAPPADVPRLTADLAEMLECACIGAPRAVDLPDLDARESGHLQRVFAREARLRGWVPIALDVLTSMLARHRGHVPTWLADRSLVIFVAISALTSHGLRSLRQVASGNPRPHLVIRMRARATRRRRDTPAVVSVHESSEPFGTPGAEPVSSVADAHTEAAARWQWLLDGLTRERASPPRTLHLARVLMARDRPFEARALLEAMTGADPPWRAQAATAISEINDRAAARVRRGWEMVDDFIDVLQLCQDVEDEQTALARVGTFLRDRLQASSVAFLVREGSTPRVLTRVGSTVATIELASRTIETGLPITPARTDGPVEATCPVRHASDVIGALWCRWSAGMPIAPTQAATLLGIAAAAAAPSVRLALARAVPATRVNAVPELVGESAAIAAVRDAIVRAAASPFPVVIEGESGSGKELAARAIHARSGRRDRRFCAINCAALVDDLVEAELFGHARGSFTGATSDRAGLFEDASGGTLFLDEIAELGPRVQATLLRALQEGEVRRVGETIVRKVDVRIVAATNRPLAAAVDAGAFRADLWYRLDVIRLTLPPLRERIEDVPILANHLWRLLAARTGSRAALSPATVAALSAYDWPGNIRELQNVLASLLVSAPRAGLVGPSSLPVHIARVVALEKGATLADARRQFEERYVRAALARAGGRTAPAARALGLSRQGLSKLMGRLGIPQSPPP